MAYQWFKFYGGEFLSDPKMLALTGNERSCWITLLSYASISDPEGTVKYLSEYQLISQSGINPLDEEWEATKGVLQKFKTLDMITDDNETIVIKNWDKRQERSLTPYERVKKFREKKRNETDDNGDDNDRIEENRKEEIRIEKNIYGEFKKVRLSSEEYSKLITYCGTEHNLKLLIVELDTYMASTKKKYDNHYATLQGWWRRKGQEHQDKNKPKRILA